jgi:hypothetical protein
VRRAPDTSSAPLPPARGLLLFAPRRGTGVVPGQAGRPATRTAPT